MSEIYRTFTSESVTQGHPDKVADIISDAILDAYMAGDRNSHVACETCVTTDFCMVFGEITSDTNLTDKDIEKIDNMINSPNVSDEFTLEAIRTFERYYNINILD